MYVIIDITEGYRGDAHYDLEHDTSVVDDAASPPQARPSQFIIIINVLQYRHGMYTTISIIAKIYRHICT